MDERASRGRPPGAALPNLNHGHLDGCVTHAVYSDAADTPPVLIVETCANGCPHQSIELPRA